MLTQPIHLIHKASAAARRSVASRRLKRSLAIGVTMLVGCAQQPTLAPSPSRPARVQPPDWFHQQVAAAHAAKRLTSQRPTRPGPKQPSTALCALPVLRPLWRDLANIPHVATQSCTQHRLKG
jgi:hypothetical protein